MINHEVAGELNRPLDRHARDHGETYAVLELRFSLVTAGHLVHTMSTMQPMPPPDSCTSSVFVYLMYCL